MRKKRIRRTTVAACSTKARRRGWRVRSGCGGEAFNGSVSW